MAERQTYYNRKEKAERCPEDFLSDISDGMASDKTIVPSLQDQFEFKPPLKQHVSTSSNNQNSFFINSFPFIYYR